jgi:general secretion pathway protein H
MTTAVRPNSRTGETGFTLVELLVVLAVLALSMSVTVSLPMFHRSTPSSEVRTHALRIVADLRTARALAAQRGHEVAFQFDAIGNAWSIGHGKRPTKLPKDMILQLETARFAIRDPTDARLIFFADGSSTGGRITLSYGGRRVAIQVAWINGAVSIDDLQLK